MEPTIHSADEAQAHYDALPHEIQGLLYSPKMFSILKQISDKHHLHIDQAGLLEAETNDVLLGFTLTEDYPAVLKESLNLEQKDADDIATDVNDLLFLPVREIMKQSQEKLAAQTPAPAPVMPEITTKREEAPPPVKKAEVLSLPEVDHLLTEKTVSVPPAVSSSDTPPPTPPSYKEDPYREPIN